MFWEALAGAGDNDCSRRLAAKTQGRRAADSRSLLLHSCQLPEAGLQLLALKYESALTATESSCSDGATGCDGPGSAWLAAQNLASSDSRAVKARVDPAVYYMAVRISKADALGIRMSSTSRAMP